MKFRVVSFREYKDILAPLFLQHWNEISIYKNTIPLELDFELYEALESTNRFVTIIAEVENKIVGYVCYALTKHPHYVTSLFAQNDAIFILPEHRIGRNALNLIKFAEEELKNIGVDIVSAHVKPQRNFGPLLKFLGYDEQEIVFTKRL